jgi:autotransporter translocation and assembly factor TamB
MRRTWIKRTLFSLLAIIIIILALPVAILNSTWALNFATKQLNTLDNIAITYQEGTLFDTLTFSDIEISVPGWDITVKQLSTGLSLDCVWEKKLCVTSLHVMSTLITQVPYTEMTETAEPNTAPANLPFPVNINQIQITDLSVKLLDETALTTALNIPHIGLKAGSNSQVWLDIAALAIDIPSLRVELPITAHVPATNVAKSAAHAQALTDTPAQPINALIDTLHQQIIAIAPQYKEVVTQWQALMEAPQPWLQAQAPITIPINLETMTLNIDAITLSNIAGDLHLSDLTLATLTSLTPEGINSAIDLTHPRFSFTSQFALARDWTHQIDSTLAWQAINLAEPLVNLSMQAGSLTLKGDISQWRLASQANIKQIHIAALQLADLQWQFNAQGDQKGITIRPSTLNYGPHAVGFEGQIPTKSSAKLGLAIKYTTREPETIHAAVALQGKLISPTLTGQITVKDIQQPEVNLHTLSIDFTGDFTSLNAQIAANWTHPNTTYIDTNQSVQLLTGQYSQSLSFAVTPQDIVVTLQTMSVNSPLGKLALAPYGLRLVPGYLRSSNANTQHTDKALLNIDQWQLMLQDESDDVVGTWEIQPIELALNDTVDEYFKDGNFTPIDINITTLNIQSLFNLANPFLAKHITISTDASIDGAAQIALSGGAVEPQIDVIANIGVTPSDWQITPKLDASITQAKIDIAAQYRLFATNQPLSLNSTGTLVGKKLGDIQYQLVMDDKLTLYTQVKSVNLGLVAPFLPQFKRFTGNTSANIALTKEGQLLSLNGILIIPELNVEIEQLNKSAVTPHGDIIITQPVEQGFSNPNAAFTAAPLDLLANIRVLIDPLQKNTVKVAGFDFSTNLQGSVEFYLAKQQPSVIGSITLNNGQYQAYGQDLLIRNGQLIFNGPASLPFIQLEAIRNPKNMSDDVIAGLKISGLPNQLDAQLFSEPMLENPNILSYLIRGKDLNDDSQEGNSVLLTNAILGFGLGKSQEAISEFGDKIGVQNLQLSTQGQGDNAQLGITGQLNERLSVEYRVGVFNAIAEFGLRYQWLPNLYVEATSGAENALDVFYQLSWGKREITPPARELSQPEKPAKN